jgi:tRNA 2-thiouridine synthesizing protein A
MSAGVCKDPPEKELQLMANVTIDAKGLKCPQPILRVAAKLPELSLGDVLEVSGDCPTFEDDMRKWCQRMGKTLLAVNQDGDAKVIRVQV